MEVLPSVCHIPVFFRQGDCASIFACVHCIVQNESGEAAAAGISGRASTAIKLGPADAATPPLLSGKGDQLQVLGFYSLSRRALLEPLMRFGIPVESSSPEALYTPFLKVGPALRVPLCGSRP